jgi:hypothetical protein
VKEEDGIQSGMRMGEGEWEWWLIRMRGVNCGSGVFFFIRDPITKQTKEKNTQRNTG